MHSHHVVLLAHPSDPRAAALHEQLTQRGWSVAPDPDRLGVDHRAALAEAIDGCAMVVALEPDDDAVGYRASVVHAVTGRERGGRDLPIVPVTPTDAPSSWLSGLELRAGVVWTQAAEVADRLHRALEQLGAARPGTASVVVVAHPIEAKAERERLRELLGRRQRLAGRVRCVWTDAPDWDAALAADLVVVLVGGELDAAGLPRLRAAVARPDAVVVALKFDEDDVSAAANALSGERVALKQGWFKGDGKAAVDHALGRADDWVERRFAGDGRGGLHDWERAWLKGRQQPWEEGRHAGLLTVALSRTLLRRDLFVPPVAAPGPWRWVDGRLVREVEPAVNGGFRRVGEDKPEAPIPMHALLALPELRCAVVEGEAGTGKTVLLQHLASVLAGWHLHAPDVEANGLDRAAFSAGAPCLRVPVLVEARRLAELGCCSASSIVSAIAAEAFPDAPRDPADAVAKVREGFQQGRYLLLVDARDEVADPHQLRRLDDGLRQLASTYPKLRLVLSTRPALHTGADLGAPFETVGLALLDDDRREQMAARWCLAHPATWPERDAELRAAMADLKQRMGDGDDGDRDPLANPLFFTCAMLLFERDRRLPNDRAELYHRLVELLCRARAPNDPVPEATRRDVALALAYAAQRSGGTSIGREAAKEAVLDLLGLADLGVAERAVDHMANHTMLFRFEGPAEARAARPWHRSFQEFLAATWLASGARDVAVIARELAAAELHDPRWTGCLRFLAGAFAHTGKARAVAWVEALRALADAEADDRRRGHLLALLADAVAEERERCFDGGALAGELAVDLAARYEAEGGRYGWRDRVMLLDALGRMATTSQVAAAESAGAARGWRPRWGGRAGDELVDPRLEDLRWREGETQEALAGMTPDAVSPRWVRVEGGRYTLGGDQDAGYAGPRRFVRLTEFWLLDTPVTVADARACVGTDALGSARFRTGLPGSSGADDWVAQRRYANRPLWGVDWFDAVAFCRWATEVWRLPAGFVVGLPTAVEWEAAARGSEGHLFPWGNEEPGREDQSSAAYDWEPVGRGPFRGAVSVGAFPGGSRAALVDLAGNVWEWTASAYSGDGAGDVDDLTTLSGGDGGLSSPDIGLSSPDAAPRVVRGGSWGDYAWRLRAAYRDHWHPDDRYASLGFRVCVRRERG